MLGFLSSYDSSIGAERIGLKQNMVTVAWVTWPAAHTTEYLSGSSYLQYLLKGGKTTKDGSGSVCIIIKAANNPK